MKPLLLAVLCLGALATGAADSLVILPGKFTLNGPLARLAVAEVVTHLERAGGNIDKLAVAVIDRLGQFGGP